jgi:5'-deoxynucleotidase YfbR-like HD superfamily hydrolase
MENEFNLIQVLNNLNNIKRAGPNLFAGVKNEDLQSIAEHSFQVINLCIVLGTKLENINLGNVVINAATHDWAESIIGDLPKSSPSYRSYFEENIKEIFNKAEEKAKKELFESGHISPPHLNETELSLLKFCDILSAAYEVAVIKHSGMTHKWLDAMFQAHMSSLLEINLPFQKDVVSEMDKIYRTGFDNFYLIKKTNSGFK